MPTSRSLGRLAMASLLVLLALAAAPMTGCGSGGGGGGGFGGDLVVCADNSLTFDEIDQVDVTGNSFPFFFSYLVNIPDGDCDFIDTLPDGNYDVDVVWSDGFTDTFFSVDIFNGFETTLTSVWEP